MANHKDLVPFILSWEGGYTNDPDDRGGETNMGVTMQTWRGYCAKKGKPATTATLKAMTRSEWTEIFKTLYWDALLLDCIDDQSVANLAADFAWASGVKTAARKLQLAYNSTLCTNRTYTAIAEDGIVGAKTIAALNGASGRAVFTALHNIRHTYVTAITLRNPSQKKYLRGWERRIDSIGYGTLTLNK